MEGLLVLGGGAAWLALSIWITLRVARYAAKLGKRLWLMAIVFVVLWPLLLLAPVADELIGKFQYERYCREADEVKIYGTIPVREDFYTDDGKWKLGSVSLPLTEYNRLRAILDSLIRRDGGTGLGTSVPAVIPVQYWETRIVNVKTGSILAEFRIYATRGGWLSRLLFERAGFFVKPQCFPRLLREGGVDQVILPFSTNVGEPR